MKKRIPIGIIFLIILAVGILGWQYYWGYIPLSSLRQEATGVHKSKILEVCASKYAQYPGPDRPFPMFSPNGRYYVDVANAKFRRAEVLRLYQTDTSGLLGTYSHFRLAIYCWAPDSSGIYVADYVPGSGTDFLFSTPGRTGPVKKLLVP